MQDVVEKMALSDDEWTQLDDGVSATLLNCEPLRWAREQPGLRPRYNVTPVNRAEVSRRELVQRYRGKQRQANALAGPPTEFNPHHPPCRSYKAEPACYICGQIEWLRRRGLQQQLPRVGARPLGPPSADVFPDRNADAGGRIAGGTGGHTRRRRCSRVEDAGTDFSTRDRVDGRGPH